MSCSLFFLLYSHSHVFNNTFILYEMNQAVAHSAAHLALGEVWSWGPQENRSKVTRSLHKLSDWGSSLQQRGTKQCLSLNTVWYRLIQIIHFQPFPSALLIIPVWFPNFHPFSFFFPLLVFLSSHPLHLSLMLAYSWKGIISHRC